MKSSKVIIGLSGGVDSAVSAYLLQQQGYRVEALFMKNWEQDDSDDYCPAVVDLADAEAVCHQLNIPLHTVNFSEEYWSEVFQHFLHEYQSGRTPNPDVLCNKEIKFNYFLKYAQKLGADYIATGHYAANRNGLLFKAKDRNKDQTYFLHAINRNALDITIFPLAQHNKSEVRAIATQLGLKNHQKKDSTGICFIGEKKFKSFLSEFILAQPGKILSTNNEYLGMHDGLMFYTLGQRQGLGIGGHANYPHKPWYVVEKNITNNELIVAQGADHPMLYSQGLLCGPIHWLLKDIPELPLTCLSKCRYRQDDQACIISPFDSSNQQHVIMFSSPQKAVTPGQYIVFYQNNQCLGGAVILSSIT